MWKHRFSRLLAPCPPSLLQGVFSCFNSMEWLLSQQRKFFAEDLLPLIQFDSAVLWSRFWCWMYRTVLRVQQGLVFAKELSEWLFRSLASRTIVLPRELHSKNTMYLLINRKTHKSPNHIQISTESEVLSLSTPFTVSALLWRLVQKSVCILTSILSASAIAFSSQWRNATMLFAGSLCFKMLKKDSSTAWD